MLLPFPIYVALGGERCLTLKLMGTIPLTQKDRLLLN